MTKEKQEINGIFYHFVRLIPLTKNNGKRKNMLFGDIMHISPKTILNIDFFTKLCYKMATNGPSSH
ncbi:MAG: hypothetical protein SVO26_04910, partial [Chloroflexota bacterium]|nr:hypothetical protein [Chloroflexota bacterium]